MKVLSRDFTRKEKILIFLLLLILAALAYYQFLDQPVRQSIANAQAEQASLQTELEAVQNKIRVLEKMRKELEDLESSKSVNLMPSYNNHEADLALLHGILDGNVLQYSIAFSDVTRNGDQIRRNFSLQFTTRTYDEMKWILEQIADSPYRCLIGDVRCSTVRTRSTWTEVETAYNINATATFFETMVGGVADSGLPVDKAAQQ